jgi:hypothetical protein
MNYDNLNAVLKYSHDVVANLTRQLMSPEHATTRRGGPEADHTFRGVLADAIDESDRPHAATESALLRDPEQHVVLDQEGRVRAGRFSIKPISAANRFVEHLEANHDCDVCFGMGWEPDDVEVTGKFLAHGDMADSGCDASPMHIKDFAGRFETALRKGLAERNQTDILNDPAVVSQLDKVKNAPVEEVDTEHQSERE